jgi:ArsR family transcriptional regulator
MNTLSPPPILDQLNALGDETRVRILAVLHALGELCVCDVEAGLDVTQSRASRHMTLLRHAGLVEDRREGQWVYYRLAEPMAPAAERLVGALRDEVSASPELQHDIEATREARRSPCR